MMRAYQIQKFGEKLFMKDIKVPKLGDYEVLAKTIVGGVCHTDLHVIDGDLGGESALPITPGHEGVGEVVNFGSKVTTFKKGDLIGIPWLQKSCLSCYLCKKGLVNLCPKQMNAGFTHPGAFGEYFVAHEKFAAHIPKTLSPPIAASILCAGITTYKALKLADVVPGSRIVISGACGGLGHLALQYAKYMGYECIALDYMTEDRKKIIKECGATFLVDLATVKKEALKDYLQSLDTSDKGIDGAIILAPVLSAVTDAVNYVSPGGTIVCVGLPKGSYEIPCVDFVLKGLHLVGSIVGTPDDLNEALEIAAEGHIKPHYELKQHSEINNVFADMKSGKITGRVILDFQNKTQ